MSDEAAGNAPAGAGPGARPVAGILWMFVTGLCFVTVTAIVKHVGQTVPAPQAVFVRYVIGIFLILPMVPAMWRAGMSVRLARGFAWRGAAHTAGALLWFFAMTQIPMAEVTAMNYLQPVYITIGAALFLGERIALRRVLAIGVAMAGALVILRPGFREVTMGHMAMILCAPAFAASYLMAKRLTELTSPAVTVGWMSVTTTIGLAPFALAVWQPLTLAETGWLALTAVIATTAHYTMMLAFRAAPITMTQPVTFLQLVWSALLGFLIFGEAVDALVILGGAIIVGSVVYIAWREASLKRAAARRARAAVQV